MRRSRVSLCPTSLTRANQCHSIIQRAGVVPMSIAGIAKEVTTIICAAWFFGDELTPLNITGVAITACGQPPSVHSLVPVLTALAGIALYTYHKYKKSMQSNLPLDPHGNPLPEDEYEAIDEDVALEAGNLGERERLTSNVDEDADSDGDEERIDGVCPYSIQSSSLSSRF